MDEDEIPKVGRGREWRKGGRRRRRRREGAEKDDKFEF